MSALKAVTSLILTATKRQIFDLNVSIGKDAEGLNI